MIPGKYNLSIQTGETVNRQFKILSATGDPFDLTGYTIQAFIKSDFTSSTVASFTCTTPDITQGVINLALSSGSSNLLTGSCYFYDVRIITGSVASYPLEGKVVISPSVTR